MNLYMATMTREAALNLGNDQHNAESFDALMSVFSSDDGLDVGQAWCAVHEVLGR